MASDSVMMELGEKTVFSVLEIVGRSQSHQCRLKHLRTSNRLAAPSSEFRYVLVDIAAHPLVCPRFSAWRIACFFFDEGTLLVIQGLCVLLPEITFVGMYLLIRSKSLCSNTVQVLFTDLLDLSTMN